MSKPVAVSTAILTEEIVVSISSVEAPVTAVSSTVATVYFKSELSMVALSGSSHSVESLKLADRSSSLNI